MDWRRIDWDIVEWSKEFCRERDESSPPLLMAEKVLLLFF